MAEVGHEAETASPFILFRNLPKMRELIDLDDLLLYLIAEGLLTDNDTEKLKIVPPINTRDVVIRELAHLIKKKGENGLMKFMSALKKSASQGNQPGHQELLQLLEENLGNTTTDQSSDQSLKPIQETHTSQMEERRVPNTLSQSISISESHRQLSVGTSEEASSSHLVIGERNSPPQSYESSLSSSPSLHPMTAVFTAPNPNTVSPEPPTEIVHHDAWKEARPDHDSESVNSDFSPSRPVADTMHTQVTHRRVSHEGQNPKHALEQHPMATNERDVLHELGCQIFNTYQYHAFQRYDYRIRTLARYLCAVLLIYQFVAMVVVTLCEDGGFLTAFQGSENRHGIALHCFILFVLRIGTRVITPALFMSQLDIPATKPSIPKSRIKVHEAMGRILVAYETFSPSKHRERIQSKLSDPSAVIGISAEMTKRHITSSWITIVHSFLFTWLLYYLGAFSMAADKVSKGQGICNVGSVYTTAIHLPLVSNPIPLSVLGECISILAILLLVGILKEFYLYENRIATYALVLGNEGKEMYNLIRKRWGTLDIYCYLMPLVLFVLAGIALLSGKGLTAEPSQEIEAVDVLNWYFWVVIVTALTFLSTSPNIWCKVVCLINYPVIVILVYVVKPDGLMIPTAGDCAVILLYICHSVVLFNFHVSLLKCHYYHYRETNSAVSIYRQMYGLTCMFFLFICVCITTHWEVSQFGHYL